MEKEIILSGMLCFMKFKFGTIPKQYLLNAMCGFYDVEIIYEGKKILYKFAEKKRG